MRSSGTASRVAWIGAVASVGVVLAPLLLGFEPVGGDPDRIFRPIKAELARALRDGRLPLWSDRFGLGVPLLAESHAAALYPPNHLLYRALDVSAAYRLAMWSHAVLAAAATFAYGRALGLTPWGSALAGLAFALCGFQAIHSSHEWAYHALAFLPMVLLAADRFVATGRLGWLAGLALAWGAQLTQGHFQVQLWTGGLALLTGLWRLAADRRPWWRGLALGAGLAWGLAAAAAQLGPTWELARFVGRDRRTFAELAFYSFPPAHWAEPAAPGIFRAMAGDPESAYWFAQQTTGFESALYVGTAPLILAFVGLAAGRRGRGLGAWWPIVAGCLVLATMPRWWPAGYGGWLSIPGMGLFRCPARYTSIASFGLALLAGAGLDATIARRRFGVGLMLAVAFGLAGVAWSIAWFGRAGVGLEAVPSRWAWPLVWTGLAWAAALGSVLAWRAGRAGPWLPLAATAIELGALYYTGTTRWGWSVPLPGASPTLERLAAEPAGAVGLVVGPIDDLPIRAGRATGSPYIGFPLPPPNDLLEPSQGGRGDTRATAWSRRFGRRWLRRLGVTHGVWPGPPPVEGFAPVLAGYDPALDALAYRPPGSPPQRLWTLYRLGDPEPPARAATRAAVVPDRESMLEALSISDRDGEAMFLPPDVPAAEGEAPRAREARVSEWDEDVGVVEGDGSFDVILRRTYYPGWTYREGDADERPVARANGGFQALRVRRAGRWRVETRYEPTHWGTFGAISIAAAASAIACLGMDAPLRRGRPDRREADDSA